MIWNGRVIACCGFVEKGDFVQVREVYVLSDFQGLGIALRMFEDKFAVFDDKKDLTIELASYNQQAFGFYQKIGFKPYKNHLQHGERYPDRYEISEGKFIDLIQMIMVRNSKRIIILGKFGKVWENDKRNVGSKNLVEKIKIRNNFQSKKIGLYVKISLTNKKTKGL